MTATVYFACNDEHGLSTGECCALRFEAGDYLARRRPHALAEEVSRG